MVGITFVDGSEAMFVIGSEGYIKTAGSTHPVAEIELYHIEKPIWEPDDLSRIMLSLDYDGDTVTNPRYA